METIEDLLGTAEEMAMGVNAKFEVPIGFALCAAEENDVNISERVAKIRQMGYSLLFTSSFKSAQKEAEKGCAIGLDNALNHVERYARAVGIDAPDMRELEVKGFYKAARNEVKSLFGYAKTGDVDAAKEAMERAVECATRAGESLCSILQYVSGCLSSKAQDIRYAAAQRAREEGVEFYMTELEEGKVSGIYDIVDIVDEYEYSELKREHNGK